MNEKHGGEGVIKAIQHNLPLSGLAQAELEQVKAEYELNGPEGMTHGNILRLQTAANLYWNAINKVAQDANLAAQDGNLAALDGYVKRYGWLCGVILRHTQQARADKENARKGKRLGAGEVLDAYANEVNDDANNE